MGTLEENRQQWRSEHRPGVPSLIDLDDELRSYIDAQAERMSYVELAKACRQQFGRGRSPSKTVIARYWQKRLVARGAARKHHTTSKIHISPQIKAFIDQRLPEMTFKSLANACRKQFGKRRAPSASAIHRYHLSTKVSRKGAP